MKRLIIIIIISIGLPHIAYTEGVFEYDSIDFFRKMNAHKKVDQILDSENPKTIVSEWAEPIISPSGEASVYVPPKEVMDFLEKPNPENAKAYFEWNLRRIKKIILAQQLLEKEVKGMKLDKVSDSADPVNISDLKGNHIYYFILKGCPSCREETKVIEDIYRYHPEIKIEAFASGFTESELNEFVFPVKPDNGMSQYFKVNSYPAIFVFNEKKEKYLISGYTDKERILRLFQ